MPRRPHSTDACRRVNIDVLRRAGSLKTIQATRNGGLALGIRTHLDVISALGEGCGSTAWVAGVVQAHSWLLSHFPEQGQDDVYGANPDAVVSAVIRPRGRAVRTADGYRLDGVWPFGSGCERAEWLLLGAAVVDDDGNAVDQGDFIVPTSSVTTEGRLVRQRAGRHRLVHDGRRRRRRSYPPLLVDARSDPRQYSRRQSARRRLGRSAARPFRC